MLERESWGLHVVDPSWIIGIVCCLSITGSLLKTPEYHRSDLDSPQQ